MSFISEPRRARARCIVAVISVIIGACAPRDDGPADGRRATADAPCDTAVAVAALPRELDEASGAAFSRIHPDIMWTHNDSGTEPLLFAIDTLGTLRRSVRIHLPANPGTIRDWEDLALAPCTAGDCIYLADIGDNTAARPAVRILRFREPDPADTAAVRASDISVFPFRYPDGPRDAEAVFILPGERVHIITKGRSGPVALYRYPGALRGDTVTLEKVQDLTPGLVQLPDQVTGAAASDDGRHVLVRTYSYLQRYDVDADGTLTGDGARTDLTTAREPQGEAVAWRVDGTAFLLGEKGFERTSGVLARTACR